MIGENDGGESSAVPHGNVGEDDADEEDDPPNDGSNSEDSNQSSGGDFFDVSPSSFTPRPGGVATAILVLTSATEIPTLPVRGSPPAFTPCCIISGSGLQLTVMSTVRKLSESSSLVCTFRLSSLLSVPPARVCSVVELVAPSDSPSARSGFGRLFSHLRHRTPND